MDNRQGKIKRKTGHFSTYLLTNMQSPSKSSETFTLHSANSKTDLEGDP